MDKNFSGVIAGESTHFEATTQPVADLLDVQLALIGGGIGDTVL